MHTSNEAWMLIIGGCKNEDGEQEKIICLKKKGNQLKDCNGKDLDIIKMILIIVLFRYH